MTNSYYSRIKDFQAKITYYAKEIFKVYGNELQLCLEDYNLLAHKDNCLESSTAFGYLIEEFLVSKLEIFSLNHTDADYVIKRAKGSATASSYDCFSVIGGLKALVNIKADKRNNNAIAAINKLYADYVLSEQIKCYLVLKVHYSIKISERDGKRKIFIDEVSSFFLEEIDFSGGHKQDHRNWSAKFNANSGRLQATDMFRQQNKVPEQNISYENTRAMLECIYNNNLSARA
ncbi:MAG: hypothetical protein LBD99_01570 [Candidatus Margulisbacteria bacterium]|jgi:hypothetical protein|nr:hypothetical protein [Candidatus Margulisiibacteriota bacterium]